MKGHDLTHDTINFRFDSVWQILVFCICGTQMEMQNLKKKKKNVISWKFLKCADDMHTVWIQTYKHFLSGRLYTDWQYGKREKKYLHAFIYKTRETILLRQKETK